MTSVSHLEEAFVTWLGQNPDIPAPVREYEFAKPRRWRFDFAWPDVRVAVEIEGLTRDGGRHQKRQGFLADAEKYEAALMLGWTVYRVPGPWVMEGDRWTWREKTLEVLRYLLRYHAGKEYVRQWAASKWGPKYGG